MTAGEIVTAIVSGLALMIVIIEKLWGGGNALAAKFHKLDKETSAAVAALETKVMLRIDNYQGNAGVGFEATKNSIHEMQKALLEFRAKIAEDLHLYIRKDDYNAGIGDIKRDVQNGFRGVEERLGQMQDLIMYANPEAGPHRPVPKVR